MKKSPTKGSMKGSMKGMKGKGKKGPPSRGQSPPKKEDDGEEIRRKLVRMTIKQEEMKDEIEKLNAELLETTKEKDAAQARVTELEAELDEVREEGDENKKRATAVEDQLMTSMGGLDGDEQFEHYQREIDSLQRQVLAANQARLRAEQALQEAGGTDDLKMALELETDQLKAEADAANQARIDAEERAAEFGQTLAEKKELESEAQRLQQLVVERDQALALAEQRKATLLAEEAAAAVLAQKKLVAEVEAREGKRREEAVALALEEERERALLEKMHALENAEDAHARELATVLQEAHLKYRQDQAQLNELQQRGVEWSRNSAESLDGLLQSLPPKALNKVFDIFEAHLPDELLDRVVDRPYMQQLLEKIKSGAVSADGQGYTGEEQRLREQISQLGQMARELEMDLMQAVLQKATVDTLRTLKPSSSVDASTEVLVAGIDASLRHMQQYVAQVSGLAEARSKDEQAAEARVAAAETALQKSLEEVTGLCERIEHTNGVNLEQAERLVLQAAALDDEERKREEMRTAHEQEVEALQTQLAEVHNSHQEALEDMSNRLSRIDEGQLPMVQCVHQALLDLSSLIRSLENQLGWCGKSTAQTPELGEAQAAALTRSRPVIFKQLTELQTCRSQAAAYQEPAGLDKLAVECGPLLDRAALSAPGSNVTPLSGAVTQIRSALEGLHRNVARANYRHEWALNWLLDSVSTSQAPRGTSPQPQPVHSPQHIQRVFDSIDTNKDGVVDRQEFVAAMRSPTSPVRPMVQSPETQEQQSSFGRVIKAASNLLSVKPFADVDSARIEASCEPQPAPSAQYQSSPPPAAYSADSIAAIHTALDNLQASKPQGNRLYASERLDAPTQHVISKVQPEAPSRGFEPTFSDNYQPTYTGRNGGVSRASQLRAQTDPARGQDDLPSASALSDMPNMLPGAGARARVLEKYKL